MQLVTFILAVDNKGLSISFYVVRAKSYPCWNRSKVSVKPLGPFSPEVSQPTNLKIYSNSANHYHCDGN